MHRGSRGRTFTMTKDRPESRFSTAHGIKVSAVCMLSTAMTTDIVPILVLTCRSVCLPMCLLEELLLSVPDQGSGRSGPGQERARFVGHHSRLRLILLWHDDHRAGRVQAAGQHGITHVVRSQPRSLATPRIHDQHVHLSHAAE